MREAGRDVLVYFDIHGIDVVLEDSEDLTYKHFASSRTQITKLIEGGATVCACPGCLKAADKTADDLMPGVEVADKDRFYSFTKGRILTIDY
jgi:intracellular sulfur oxidation DsrE/DsrF family protein